VHPLALVIPRELPITEVPLESFEIDRAFVAGRSRRGEGGAYPAGYADVMTGGGAVSCKVVGAWGDLEARLCTHGLVVGIPGIRSGELVRSGALVSGMFALAVPRELMRAVTVVEPRLKVITSSLTLASESPEVWAKVADTVAEVP